MQANLVLAGRVLINMTHSDDELNGLNSLYQFSKVSNFDEKLRRFFLKDEIFNKLIEEGKEYIELKNGDFSITFYTESHNPYSLMFSNIDSTTSKSRKLEISNKDYSILYFDEGPLYTVEKIKQETLEKNYINDIHSDYIAYWKQRKDNKLIGIDYNKISDMSLEICIDKIISNIKDEPSDSNYILLKNIPIEERKLIYSNDSLHTLPKKIEKINRIEHIKAGNSFFEMGIDINNINLIIENYLSDN